MKLIEIENRRCVIGLVRHTIIIPTQSRADREIWSNFPLILKIRHVEHTPQLVAAPWGSKGDPVKRGIREGRFIRSRIVSERKDVVSGLALVQANPPNLHAHLEGVPAVGPGKVIDHSERRSDLDVGIVVVESDEGVRVHRIGKRARLGIVWWWD